MINDSSVKWFELTSMPSNPRTCHHRSPPISLSRFSWPNHLIRRSAATLQLLTGIISFIERDQGGEGMWVFVLGNWRMKWRPSLLWRRRTMLEGTLHRWGYRYLWTFSQYEMPCKLIRRRTITHLDDSKLTGQRECPLKDHCYWRPSGKDKSCLVSSENGERKLKLRLNEEHRWV